MDGGGQRKFPRRKNYLTNYKIGYIIESLVCSIAQAGLLAWKEYKKTMSSKK